MKVIGLKEYGGPEVLAPYEQPEPHAGHGEVRVKVAAATINPADVMLREGLLAAMYDGAPKPFVPGMDIAGVIDQIGEGVHPSLGLEVGQRVVGIVDNAADRGGYSEYVALPAASVTAAPAGATPADASTFLMNALTARNALDLLALPEGSTVLVTGAAGAVGSYAVPLAHADGLRVIALASAEDEDFVTGLGADVFVTRSDDPVAAVIEAAGGQVDAVIDAATLYAGIVGAVKDGGKLVDLRFWDGIPGRGVELVRANVRQRATDTSAITRLREQVEAGVLPLRVAATFPADEAPAAHAMLDAGHVRGRIVLTFGD